MATGDALLDAQHQRLLELFNRAAHAQARGVQPEEMNGLLDALADYTRDHFRAEALLMRQWQVDGAHRKMHLQAHDKFRGFLQRARRLHRDCGADVSVELLSFLAQWLLRHIMDVDRQLVREVQARQAGEARAMPLEEHDRHTQDRLVDTVSDLSDALGQRTFDLLLQRQELLDVQTLYRAWLHCGDVLIQCRHEHEMLASLCAKLSHDTPFHAAWIGRPGPSGVFEVLALAGEGAEQVRSAPPRLAQGETASVAAKAWDTGTLRVCNDTLADPTLQPWHAGFNAHRWLSVLALPIFRATRVWAILTLAAPRREGFDAGTVEVCTRIAALLGHGLDELDLKERIRSLQLQEARMARTDTLTGLPNRLALEEYLPPAIARARRRGTSLALGVIDLDDFKPVNDRFGHDAGDELLRAVSRRLREWLRESDFIARLGGDEFVVVLEDLEHAQELSQLSAALRHLHRAVETPFEVGGAASASVDMTMGLALFPLDGDEAEALLRQADAAMYQAKQSKRVRAQWWRVGVSMSGEQLAETAFDPFGPEMQELMQSVAPHIQVVAEQFSAAFYRELSARAETASVLASLTEPELQELVRKQAGHLRFLLDAHTSCEQAREAARRLGTVHGLIGLSGASMALVMGLYRDLLHAHFDAALLTTRTRYRVLRTAEARLQLELQGELEAMQWVLDQYQSLLARPQEGRGLTADWVQAELEALAALPGMRAAVVCRPDAHNRLVIEHAAGSECAAFVEAHRARNLYPVLDPRDARGRGLVANTWMTDCQQEIAAFGCEPRTAPWQTLMSEFGIRSAVTLPVHRHGAIHAVLMLFGAYPHQFTSAWMRTWRVSLQNRWDQMTRASQSRGHAIDTGEVAQIRALLYSGGLEMFVQPVVELESGTVLKAEALARLRTPQGTLLAPAQFLPALGETDLDSLFRQGLQQGLTHLRRWREQHGSIGLAINVAPSSLVHPDCSQWVEEALRVAQVAPEHLVLELLESQALEAITVDEAITRLAATGVKIAMDDLGSGFSNLKRLADLPFDVIKIDQNLVKDLARDPIKALSLIRTVVQMGQDLEREVVAEGLEDPA
ncbi:MAG: EAL domain-containing protein, partial [Steroidobacteraceae bacterium]